MQTQTPTHVPLKTRMAWGAGGLADNFITSSLIVLAMPIYNITLGMDPVKVGIAMSIPRLFDAITDPIMGNISDNTRSRFGRRKPYIALGAILSAILLPLIWMPPVRTEEGMFWYFTLMAIVYTGAYTVFVIPYTALGYELTTDYNERTKVLAWRMYIGLLGSLTVPWLYKLCLLPIFGGDAAVGVLWVGIALGAVIIITGILPVLSCRENKEIQNQEKINLFHAMLYTLKNKPYLILLGGFVIFMFALFGIGTLSLYVNIYYVYGGDEASGATLSAMGGSLAALTSYLSLPLLTWFSIRYGKRNAMIGGLSVAMLGVLSMWFTITPKMPYLQLVSFFICGIGLQGCWLMLSSMVADICDEDELKTGLRREGIYGAVYSFAQKASLALTAVVGGLVIKFSGFDTTAAKEIGVSSDVLHNMKLFFIVGQAVAFLLTIIVFVFYPITKEKSLETRRILNERSAAKHAAANDLTHGND
ncbi:MAG: MFS transporter [Phycisphaerae bacterium]|nr:MFS transporter [Phycisphaerae bacterium]